MDLYDGGCARSTRTATSIFDHVDNAEVPRLHRRGGAGLVLHEVPVHQRSIGPEEGWYRVGPLARVNACDFIDTPLGRGGPAGVHGGHQREAEQPDAGLPLGAHDRDCCTLPRRSRDLLNDADLQGTDLTVKGERRDEAVGILEAPRGTLFHHYRSTRTTRSRCAT
jgi:NAD-reducing hydrogenase large subunit